MARRIYWLTAIVSTIVLAIFLINHKLFLTNTVIWATGFLYFIIVGCVHGILAHSLKVYQKGSLLFYPILMGMLFAVLVGIYFYAILPLLMK